MVDVEFKSRAKHFVPLSVLKGIVAGGIPGYLTAEDVDAIKGHFFTWLVTNFWLIRSCAVIFLHSGMALVSRGRLSVQRVERAAWDAIQKMADKGGWSEEHVKTRGRKKQALEDKEGDEGVSSKGNPRKRQAEQVGEDSAPVRRSARTRTKG